MKASPPPDPLAEHAGAEAAEPLAGGPDGGSAAAVDLTNRLALRPPEAAAVLGISERLLWTLTKDRTSGLPHFKAGTRTLYPVEPLRAWLAAQATKGGRR